MSMFSVLLKIKLVTHKFVWHIEYYDTYNIWFKKYFQLIAEDEYGYGLSSSTTVKVFIEDINDNAPVFNQTYVFNLISSVAVGSEVGRVTATDADVSTQNSTVLYFIDGGGYGKFQIDSQTGKLQMLMSNKL